MHARPVRPSAHSEAPELRISETYQEFFDSLLANQDVACDPVADPEAGGQPAAIISDKIGTEIFSNHPYCNFPLCCATTPQSIGPPSYPCHGFMQGASPNAFLSVFEWAAWASETV